MDKIEFYTTKGNYGCFSNFSRHPVKLKDQIWPTSEHYFQAQKFAGTKFESAVRKCDSPKEAAEMGRDRALPLRPDWLQVRDDIMREVVYAKFLQNEDCKKVLLSTGDAELVEHTVNDNYWADGGDGSGKNMLGKILMETRARLRGEISEEDDEYNRVARLSQLVKEFESLVNGIYPQIQTEIELAKRALARAKDLSEKHGIPFETDIYEWKWNSYVPKSFSYLHKEMFELDDLDELNETLKEILGFNPDRYVVEGEPGWESDGW